MKIKLRPIRIDDLSQFYIWRNDPFIMARTRQYRMLEWREHLSWFNNLDPNVNLMRVIVIPGGTGFKEFSPHIDSNKDNIVGVCGLTNIDWVNGGAELSIYIGDEDNRIQGYGLQAIQELKRICFEELNLHRFWAEVYSFNKPMIIFLDKCGFGLDGILRDTIYRNGKYHDSSFYTFLKKAWEEEQGIKELGEGLTICRRV